MNLKHHIFLVLFLLASQFVHAQSAFGYLGKRFYIKGQASASPSLFGKNLDGDNFQLRFNLIGSGSIHYIINRTNEFDLNYRRSVSIGSVYSGTIADYQTNNPSDVGEFRFRTNEYGLSYRWFTSGLNAPQGTHFSLGFGMALSSYDTDIQAVGVDDNNIQTVYRFSNTNQVYSPMFRMGFGKQTVFWERLVYDVGVDIGINLGYSWPVFALPLLMTDLVSVPTSGPMSNAELGRIARRGVQSRLFYKNLINFRMGLAFLIF